MQITKAEFRCSSEKISQVPKDELKDIAFIGRSNVGKSSLINMLTGRKGLAKVSSTPGKTRLINHFCINNSWYLVDLPGYGYARTSKATRGEFARIITSYVENRENLTCLFVLVDSRHAPQKIDREFMAYLATNGIPFVIVMTKTDKLSKKALGENVEVYKNIMLEEWEELPPIFFTSSLHKTGTEEILDFIEETNNIIRDEK